jgi:hypothetical protein
MTIEPIEGIQKVPNGGRVFIYFIRSGEFVKIGKSRHWKKRMENMQVGSPYTVVPLLVLVAPPEMERKLHNRFKADHFRGEWFHMGLVVLAFIKENLKNCAAKGDVVELPKIDPKRSLAASWDDF